MSQVRTFSLSEVQKQFWLQYQQDPEGSAYNMASLFEISGPLNEDLVRDTLTRLVSRYDMLKARFIMGEEGPEQIICNYMTAELILREYTVDVVESDIRAPFNIAEGPLFRFVLYKKKKHNLLLFVFHHLIVDLRSKDIFGEEFSLIYNSLNAGKDVTLGEPVTYESYVSWMEGFTSSVLYGKMCAFWEEAGLLSSPLSLTADYDRPPVQGTLGTRISEAFPAELSMNLHRYCESNNTSPFLVLLSAYYLLLHKYSGQDRISIGIPRTNRPEPSFENVFGCFVNILPMMIDFSEEMAFSDLLRQVRRQMLMIHRNQYVPYLKVIKSAQGDMDRKYNPLFQAGFTNEYPMELTLDGLTVEPLVVPSHGSQLDFFLYFWKQNGIYHWECEYNTGLFTELRAEMLRSSFLTILEQIIKGKDFPLSGTDWISKEWERKVCYDWNDTSEEPVGFKGVHQSFEDRVREMPGKTALRYKGASLCYGELNRRANILARELMLLGAGAETVVGLSLERSFEMVVGMLGILKAGSSYMPMEPTHPGEYKKYLVEDTNLSLLLTKEAYEENLKLLFPHLNIICLDRGSFLADEDPGNPDVPVERSTRSYLFYTSGSTGKPKGVEVEHGGLTDRILWMDRTFRFGKERKTLLKTPYNFDVSGMEFWLPLTTGAPLVIGEPGGHLDNAYLANVIREEAVSILHFVPSLLNVFLNTTDSESLGMIKDVFCCGEALPAAVVNNFYLKFPNANLHNLYGPTEATIFITYWSCGKDCSIVPIGKPVSDTQAYVLDSNLKPVPPGVLGDLYLSGSGLARGYYKRLDLTERVFITHFLDHNKKMYKSGDLAQWTLDGDLLFFGRSDNQVQLHGQRIELGEIEGIINNHPGVKTSAVIVDGDFGAEQRLVAYVVCKDKKVGSPQLKSHILLHSPKYMVPSLFFFLDDLPLSSNGKLDRKKLPRSISQDKNEAIVEDILEGELEKQIAGVWQKILNVRVGSNDNFFDLGGTSLQIMEMHKELAELLDRDIPVSLLFRNTTVNSIAGYLSAKDSYQQLERIATRARKQKQIKRIRVSR